MTPVEQLTVAKYGCNLTEANLIMQGSKKGQHDVIYPILIVTGLSKDKKEAEIFEKYEILDTYGRD